MKSALKRIVGFIRMILAAVSLLLVLAGLVLVWRAREPATKALTAGSIVFEDTLDTTGKALVVTQQTLQTTTDVVAAVERTSLSVAQAISDTTPTVASATTLVGRNLAGSARSARTTLSSAASSARLEDDLLGSLAQIPLLNLNYQPDTPLSAALESVASSLEELPDALSDLAADLSNAGDNLGHMSDGLTDLANELARIKDNLASARDVVARYQRGVSSLRSRVIAWRPYIPTAVTGGMIVISFLFYWLVVAQIREVVAGWNWLRKG